VFQLRHIPNLITVIRILLIVPIAIALVHQQLMTTLLLFAVAAASDVIDGFLARYFKWQSVLGSILDPIADKLLLATMFITLAVLKLVPLWLMSASLLRDIVIVSGAAAYRFFIGPVLAHPSRVSKFNTLCQGAFILVVVVSAAFDWPPPWVSMALGALAFVTIAISGLDYVLTYGRLAARNAGQRAATAEP
jgi:cardiolipin synthase (CMP-forming)